MASKLGKRKRVTREELEQSLRSPSASSDSQTSDTEDVQALFRRAFEANFAPLAVEPLRSTEAAPGSLDEESEVEESDWSGITSDEEGGNAIEVIDYAKTQDLEEQIDRAELKAFMSSRPPSSSTSASSKPRNAAKAAEEDSLEASHLKNDVALQSLLREASLLSRTAPTFSGFNSSGFNSTKASSASTGGAMRHKLIDMHLQELGAKTSVFTQAKMPMKERKGIAAKKTKREDGRRREAKENGIVLERPDAGKRKGVRSRSAGKPRGGLRGDFGAASVGKFKNGALTLSRSDVFSITRSGGGGTRGGRSGRGSRGGRRGDKR